jgi:3-oxoadipate enol-lactonase/4-carboxymuconolactone decarboxylase
MPFVNAPGARIYWTRDGLDDAPCVVLLNSIGTDMDLWADVLPYLREYFTLLRIDTRGHGASSIEAGDASMARLAEDVLLVADVAGISRFAVVGVSLGGMIGMELALRSADRVEAAVLVCTSATMDSAAWADRVAKVRREGVQSIADLAIGRFFSPVAEPAIVDTVRRKLLAMDSEGYAAAGAAIRDMDLAGRIGKIRCPTLVISGSRDSSTPHEGHGDYLVRTIPGASSRLIEAAHLAPLEAPEALAAALLEFLEPGTNCRLAN